MVVVHVAISVILQRVYRPMYKMMRGMCPCEIVNEETREKYAARKALYIHTEDARAWNVVKKHVSD